MTQSSQNQGITPDDMVRQLKADVSCRFKWSGVEYIRGRKDFCTAAGRVRCTVIPSINYLVAKPKNAQWHSVRQFFWLDGKRISKAALAEKLSQVSPG